MRRRSLGSWLCGKGTIHFCGIPDLVVILRGDARLLLPTLILIHPLICLGDQFIDRGSRRVEVNAHDS
jgi:hypothetical protein